jgi:hypothetical protein
MYLYYALQAMGVKVNWGMLVTALQIAQMMVGCATCVAVMHYNRLQSGDCDDPRGLAAGVVLYASYLALFVHFAVGRWCSGARTKQAGATRTKGE